MCSLSWNCTKLRAHPQCSFAECNSLSGVGLASDLCKWKEGITRVSHGCGVRCSPATRFLCASVQDLDEPKKARTPAMLPAGAKSSQRFWKCGCFRSLRTSRSTEEASLTASAQVNNDTFLCPSVQDLDDR